MPGSIDVALVERPREEDDAFTTAGPTSRPRIDAWPHDARARPPREVVGRSGFDDVVPAATRNGPA